MRLFYAVKLPPQVAGELAQAQSALKGNWRKVAPEQFHVTLAYLPNAREEQLPGLRAVGVAAAREVSAFEVRVRGSGYFPAAGSPRVWFAKVEAPELEPLAATLAGRLKLPDDQAFKPHVTLARKKGPAPRVPPVVWNLSWQVREVLLIRSTLRPSGPIYETLSTFRLGGGRTPDSEPIRSNPPFPAPGGNP